MSHREAAIAVPRVLVPVVKRGLRDTLHEWPLENPLAYRVHEAKNPVKMRYWLLKTEPDTFSFEDLKKRPKQTEPWNGVRNYQVRNMMRDDMKVGDLGLFYHSSCEVPGVAGVVRIVSEGKPDPTQFDPKSEYYDKGSKKEEPRWLLVDVAWEADFPKFVPLTAMQAEPRLADMIVVRRGNRLSITPVEKKHFDLVCKMGGKK